MKMRWNSYDIGFIRESKKYSLLSERFLKKRFNKIWFVKNNNGISMSNTKALCKVKGQRRAIHSKLNVSRHINRWQQSNKYICNWKVYYEID